MDEELRKGVTQNGNMKKEAELVSEKGTGQDLYLSTEEVADTKIYKETEQLS